MKFMGWIIMCYNFRYSSNRKRVTQVQEVVLCDALVYLDINIILKLRSKSQQNHIATHCSALDYTNRKSLIHIVSI